MTAHTEPRRRLVLAGVMGSVFLAAMESTVVATAMPTVIATLGGIQIYSWVFSGFLLASTVTMPSGAGSPTSSAGAASISRA